MKGTRLNRYLSICGVTSRRKADVMISDGRVTVNGSKVTQLGFRVDPEKDQVSVDGNPVLAERKRYIKFYKPRYTVTTLAKKEGKKKSISDLISGISERVYPVGRLDFDVEGLLILTNDGELAQRIHHPGNMVRKTYLAKVEGSLSEDIMDSIREGKELEDGFVKPDDASMINSDTLKISFHEGKKHLVKRYLAAFGHPVSYLKRTSVGGINLGNLQTGCWTDLSGEELRTIRNSAGLEQ